METTQDLHHYRIQELISESPVAYNWLAQNQAIARKIRIKQIKKAFFQKQDQQAILRSIAQENALLEHGHIAILYDYIETPHEAFFIYDYIQGTPLDKFLQNSPSTEQRKDIFLQVLSAVAYAHRQGVLHLNLSPSNILITPEGKAFLNDFAFVRISPEPYAFFSSPEQLNGGFVDSRSDIFALGKLLSYLFPNPSPQLYRVIQKACATEAYERYQTCEELQNDLQHAIFEATHAEPRNTWLAPTMSIGILLTLFAIAWWSLRMIIQKTQSNTNQQATAFQSGNPTIIPPPTDTIDYTKLAEAKQKKEEKKHKEESKEERLKDSLKKVQEERKKLEKERKEKALKNLIVDGQFVSSQLGEYKINVEIYNGNKDIDLERIIIVVSYFGTQGEPIDKEEKVIDKLPAQQAMTLEVVKKINAARFSCKVKDVQLPPIPQTEKE